MSDNSKAKECREEILEKVGEMDLPGFIKSEMKDILKHLNVYKLQNIIENMDMLEEYLMTLKNNYTEEVMALTNQ